MVSWRIGPIEPDLSIRIFTRISLPICLLGAGLVFFVAVAVANEFRSFQSCIDRIRYETVEVNNKKRCVALRRAELRYEVMRSAAARRQSFASDNASNVRCTGRGEFPFWTA